MLYIGIEIDHHAIKSDLIIVVSSISATKNCYITTSFFACVGSG